MAAATNVEETSGITRREFLYYIFGASIALYLGQGVGLILWFALPRIKEGTFGGLIPVDPSRLPKPNESPVDNPLGRFWLVNIDVGGEIPGNSLMSLASDEADKRINGYMAVYKVCTHLGCIYGWNAATDRFLCPCHGSKYRLDGRRIESPAPRNLDRFRMTAHDADGVEIFASGVDELGQVAPLVLNDDDLQRVVEIKIDTSTAVDGAEQTLLLNLGLASP